MSRHFRHAVLKRKENTGCVLWRVTGYDCRKEGDERSLETEGK